MYVLLDSQADIQRAQREVEATFKLAFPEIQVKNIGWQGGRIKNARLATSGAYWYYAGDARRATTPRRLNWFGKLGRGRGVAIAVEVNTPVSGNVGLAAGFFARNVETGRTYLFHSGRVAGGTPGVKRDALLSWSGLKLEQVATTSGKPREGIMIMPTKGRGAARGAIAFVDAVVEFKEAVRAGKLNTKQAQKATKEIGDYYDEYFGRKTGKVSSRTIDYESRHGEVVKELHALRKADIPKGQRMAKSRFLDLGVQKGSVLVEAYEVKTSRNRSVLYAAIGQLLVHGGAPHCKRYLVIPKGPTLPTDIASAMAAHRITIVEFTLTEESVEVDWYRT